MRSSLAAFSTWTLLIILLTFTAASGGERPKITVGGDHDNPPYEFLENGKPTGFNIELMRAVAEVMGFDVEFRLGPWSKVREELEQGKIDALAGMYYSPQRAQLLDFSVPHTMVTSAIFVRKGSPVRSFEDIKGKEVIVQRGDIIHDYLRQHNLTPHIVTVTDPEEALRLLASGKHDCALMPSRLQGEYLVKKLNLLNIRFIKSDLPQLRYCFAVRKGNRDLLHRLDEGLNILKLTGRYRELNEKWFGVYEKRNLWKTIRYYVLALALSLALVLGFLIWSGMLKRRVEKQTAELRKREEELRFTQYAIDKTLDQAFWMTEDGCLFYVNDAACRALGYAREELVGMSIPDIDPSHPPEAFAEHWRDLRENGHVRLETLHRAKDGRVYPVEIRANHVVFDGKEYNCAFVTDISERKRAEEELRENEEKFRVLAETSPAAICVYQGEYIVYLNAAMIRLTGYTEQELMEMRFWEWMHEDFRESARARGLARQRGETIPSRYEIKYFSKNGEEKWLFLSAGRIEYKGKPAGIATMFDITDRKRMEDELQQAHNELEKRVEVRTAELARTTEALIAAEQEKSLFLNITDAIVTYFDTDMIIRWANKAAGDSVNMTPEELEKRHCWEVWHQRQEPCTGCPVLLARDTGQPQEAEIRSPDGRVWYIRAYPVMSDTGQLIGMVEFCQDFTERKLMEEELLLSHFCINQAAIGISQISLEDGKILRANDFACRCLGYSSEELSSMSFLDLDPTLTCDQFHEVSKTVSMSGSMTFETVHRRKDGTLFPVEITLNVVDFHGVPTGFSFERDITERKRAEEALRESETRVRRKLESILDPEGDIGELDLADIIDAPEVQALMDDLYRLAGLKMSIIDLKGRVLVDVGWQDICSKFHRTHSETLAKCHESDTDLTVGVPPGEFRTYRCRNNMWHLVTPIIVGGRHMGNLFMGQFFFANEELDYDLFRSQARRYGFPEEEYIAALEAVPRHSEECVDMGKTVFLRLTDMFSKLSYGNIKLARSLSERDRLTETLQEANLVVENSPVVLFRWQADDAWPVELVSANIIQFGYTPDEFLSDAITYSSIIHPEDLERVTREVHDLCNEGADQLRLEYRIRTKGGDIRWVNELTNVERDANGCVKNFQGIVIDVTERKRAEEQLKQKKELLEELNSTLEKRIHEEVEKNREKDIILIQQNRQAALGEMFDHIAHQWKQPLNTIAVIIQALGSTSAHAQVTTGDILETVASIMDMVAHMAQTVDVFRNFYKPDKERSAFLVKESIDKALTFVMPVFRRFGIEVDLDADDQLLAFGYPKEYAQVLLNILANAKDALTERGVNNPRINIKAFADGDNSVVTITDNAGGIPDQSIGSIFDLYFTTKELSGGTGIGLYMSKNIIEKNMGGKIAVSNMDNGAQFRIELGKA